MVGYRLVLLVGLVGCLGGVVSCGGGSGLGEVQTLKGKASVRSGDKDTTCSKHKGTPFKCGDTIVTEEGSQAIVRAGKQVYVLESDTTLRIDLASSTAEFGPRKIAIAKGAVTVRMPDITEENKFPKLQVVGDSCSIGARGGVFDVAVKPGTGTTVAVLKGHVEVFPANAELIGGITADGKGVKNPKQLPTALGTVEEDKQQTVTAKGPGTSEAIADETLARMKDSAKK